MAKEGLVSKITWVTYQGGVIEGGEREWILALRRRWDWFSGNFAKLGWNVTGFGLDSVLLLVTDGMDEYQG